MKTTTTHYISHRECPFTWNGTNLVNLRRTSLYKLSQSLKIVSATPDSSKQKLLEVIIPRLSALEFEAEISSLINE